jgi:hypothetical protein
MEKLRAGRANIYFVIKKKPETAYKFQNGGRECDSFREFCKREWGPPGLGCAALAGGMRGREASII